MNKYNHSGNSDINLSIKVLHLLDKFFHPILNQLMVFLFYLSFEVKQLWDMRSILGGQDIGNVFLCVCLVLLRAYLLCVLLTVVRKKTLKVTIYGIMLALHLVKKFLALNFSLGISPIALTLLAETNRHEVTDFINTFLFSTATFKILIAGGLTVVLIMIGEKICYRYNDTIMRKCKPSYFVRVLFAVILICGLFKGMNMYGSLYKIDCADKLSTWERNNTYALYDMDCVIESFWGVHIASVEVEKAIENTSNMKKENSIISKDDSLNVVFVIGESFIKWHSNLYGYPLVTTPNMTKEKKAGRLYAFNDVCTPYNSTSKVIRNLLSCSSIGHGETWNQNPNFLSVVKNAGYNVLWWDNQKNMDKSAVYSFALNSYLYNPRIMQKSYSQMNERSYDYDGELINSFFQSAKLDKPYNFVVLHFVGQHFAAGMRFPHTKENMHFHIQDVPFKAPYLDNVKRQYIADYDNATLYNDKQMERLFNYFNQSNTVIVYISDHGDSVYEYADEMGRKLDHLNADRIKYQFAVPFFIWMSDRYRLQHPQVVSAIKQALNRPFMTDDICQVFFYLTAVSTPYYKEDRNLLSPKFRASKRIINDGYDYDRVPFK